MHMVFLIFSLLLIQAEKNPDNGFFQMYLLNISSQCINRNVLIDLRSICMQKNSSILEH